MYKFFQRFFSVFVVVAIIISLYPALKVNASTSGTLSSGVKWELDDEGTLTIFPGDSGEGTIDSDAFRYNKNVKRVVIEDGITNIGNSAFNDCLNLTEITIPDSVISFGNYVFSGCERLKTVVIPEGVTTISRHLFDNCLSLTSITLPSTLITIDEYSFYKCYNLQSIIIPNGVTTINSYAFDKCKSLTSIEIPSSVIYIGDYVFYDCTSLNTVVMDESLYDPGIFFGVDVDNVDFRYYRNLTVNGGSADIDNVYNTCDVTITADVSEGKAFVKWEVNSGSAALDDVNSATTTFTMPDEDVEITAVYKDITKTVSFDSNGHGTAPAAQTVTYGEKVTKPTDLTETGYTFGGWYTDSDCTSVYEFDSAVKSDFTLYAKWTAVSSGSESGFGSGTSSSSESGSGSGTSSSIESGSGTNSESVKTVANTYTVVTGGDGTWDGVSDYVIRVKSDSDDEHCIDRFLWASVDGHELDVGKESEIAPGSTIVTIKSDYLKTLSAGTHNIVVNFTDNSITTTITINNAATGSSLPSTGEMQSVAMYIGLAMIIAASALSVMGIRKRKEV